MELIEDPDLRDELQEPALSFPPGPLDRVRAELIDVSRLVYDRGLTVGINGNASVRVPGGAAVLIKVSGACMGRMSAGDTVLVGLDGAILEGPRRPSKEIDWHLGIYRTRPEIGGIVHAHPPYATAWAVANRVRPVVNSARELLGPIELIDFEPPGSSMLAALVTRAFCSPAVRVGLLREHGIVAAGTSLHDAYHLAEHLEDTARVALFASAIAGPPAAHAASALAPDPSESCLPGVERDRAPPTLTRGPR